MDKGVGRVSLVIVVTLCGTWTLAENMFNHRLLPNERFGWLGDSDIVCGRRQCSFKWWWFEQVFALIS